MIPVKTLQRELDQRLNRISSEHEGVYTIQEKDRFINRAIEIWQQNITALAEVNSRTREQLRPLLCSNEELAFGSSKEDFDVFPYPEDFYRRLRVYGKICANGCPVRKLKITVQQRDDLDKVLDDCFWDSSFLWGEGPAVESRDGLEVYHQSLFEIKNIYIDYYVKIPKVYSVSLIVPENCYEHPITCDIITEDHNLEYIDNVDQMRQILDIAALLARVARGDSVEMQLELSNIFNTEKIYLN
jgi:hypothetical protein